MEVRDKIYINGASVCPAGPGILEVIDSGTEEVLATIPEGNAGGQSAEPPGPGDRLHGQGATPDQGR